MNEDTLNLARRLLQVLLPLGKSVTTELRHTGQLLAPAHFQTMGTLYLRPANLSELAELQGVSLPTVSNTIRSLEERGWVKRTRSEKDRRIVIVELTEAGCDRLGDLTDTVLTMLQGLLNSRTAVEHAALSEGLEVLEAIFDTISLPNN